MKLWSKQTNKNKNSLSHGHFWANKKTTVMIRERNRKLSTNYILQINRKKKQLPTTKPNVSWEKIGKKKKNEIYLSSETLITPSSPLMNIAALMSSLVPSNLLSNSGLFVVLKRSFAFRGAGFISAAIIYVLRFIFFFFVLNSKDLYEVHRLIYSIINCLYCYL